MQAATAINSEETSRLERLNDIFWNGVMWVLLLEAGVAFLLLAFIVWWTMFSGRKPDAPPPRTRRPDDDAGPRD